MFTLDEYYSYGGLPHTLRVLFVSKSQSVNILSYVAPASLGKIKIQDILACGFLDDLLEVSMHCTCPVH